MYHVKVTFTEPLLGTAPLDKEIYSTYIADRRVEAGGDFPHDEIESIQEDRGKTGFHRDAAGNPIIYDYTWKGFFKETCGTLARVDDSLSKKLKAYKKIIDGLVFIFPRQIPLILSAPLGTLERPLRAQTAQGERVALAWSETAPAGTTMEFEIEVLESRVVTRELLVEWLDYGRLRGLGVWRNASWGRFLYELSAG